MTKHSTLFKNVCFNYSEVYSETNSLKPVHFNATVKSLSTCLYLLSFPSIKPKQKKKNTLNQQPLS